MKKLIKLSIMCVVLLSVISCGYERIDAGHVGIKVNLYGDEKGVDNVTEVTGAQWYNPIRTQIHEFPTFVQNAVWTADERGESKTNEEFALTTKDGLTIRLDISLNYLVPAQNAVSIFKKYGKPLDEVGATVLRNYTRDGYNTAASRFTAEEIYSNREQFKNVADSIASAVLSNEGFQVERIVLLNEIRLPHTIIASIEGKIQARQLALQKEMELQQAEADAKKAEAQATGRANAMKIEADAERYAYQQKQAVLTPLLVQQQFIEKWDGKLPVYGTLPTIFKNIQ